MFWEVKPQSRSVRYLLCPRTRAGWTLCIEWTSRTLDPSTPLTAAGRTLSSLRLHPQRPLHRRSPKGIRWADSTDSIRVYVEPMERAKVASVQLPPSAVSWGPHQSTWWAPAARRWLDSSCARGAPSRGSSHDGAPAWAAWRRCECLSHSLPSWPQDEFRACRKRENTFKLQTNEWMNENLWQWTRVVSQTVWNHNGIYSIYSYYLRRYLHLQFGICLQHGCLGSSIQYEWVGTEVNWGMVNLEGERERIQNWRALRPESI